jgi:ureidoglycolate lyase
MTYPTRQPLPLSQSTFAPFGDVLEATDSRTHFAINHGQTERYHDLANIDVAAHDGHPIISLFRTTPLPQPIVIELLERHPHSSQAFMPLGQQPYLVVVAPPGELDESAIAVFLAQPGQGVNYHAGTWHHYSLALNCVSDFLVIDRGNPPGTALDKCDEQRLQQPFSIDLPGVAA